MGSVRSEDTVVYMSNAGQVDDDRIVAQALDILSRRLIASGADVLTNPGLVKSYLRLRLGKLGYEVFGMLLLDNQHQVLSCEELFRGTIDGCTVYPREVIKTSLDHNAAAVILYHNHPSGVVDPSQADRALTRKLKDAFEVIEVRTLDHIIVSAYDSYSFAENGIL